MPPLYNKKRHVSGNVDMCQDSPTKYSYSFFPLQWQKLLKNQCEKKNYIVTAVATIIKTLFKSHHWNKSNKSLAHNKYLLRVKYPFTCPCQKVNEPLTLFLFIYKFSKRFHTHTVSICESQEKFVGITYISRQYNNIYSLICLMSRQFPIIFTHYFRSVFDNEGEWNVEQKS